jgi:hypothetical protein
MRITKKRATAIGAGLGLCLLAGGVSYGFWTTSGAGGDSAATGTVSPVTIVATSSAISGLYPGGPAANISGKFTNPNPGKVYVNQVTVSIASITPSQANTGLPACTTADFTLTQPNATAAEISSGTNVGAWGGTTPATIAMVDSATNQENCKNVTVALAFTSN